MLWQSQLRAACINSISPDDMVSIVQKQLERAKEGDERAIAFVMNLIGTNQKITVNNHFTDVESAARIRRS